MDFGIRCSEIDSSHILCAAIIVCLVYGTYEGWCENLRSEKFSLLDFLSFFLYVLPLKACI